MFVQSQKFVKNNHKNTGRIQYYGQESNEQTYKLARMNLALRGIDGSNIKYGNSYTNDQFSGREFDIVIANPPFNDSKGWKIDQIPNTDPRFEYGKPPKGNANYFWIQHFITHMNKEKGRAGFVMANGALSAGNKEGEIREHIIDDDLVEVVITCPPKLFYNVAIPSCLWFLAKDKGVRKAETLFINIDIKACKEISRKNVEFTEEYIKKVADKVAAWRAGKGYENIPGFCRSVRTKEIRENGYTLVPGRYIGTAEDKTDDVPYEKKMPQLIADFEEQVPEGVLLDKDIKKQLKRVEGI